jgi:hypothetical protein
MATGSSWRQVLLGSGRPSSLVQAVAKVAVMAAVLVPLAWAITDDLPEAALYNGIFLLAVLVVDLLLLWNSR